MSLAPTPSQHFVSLFTDAQSRLYAFIYSMVGSGEDARDVLQETNLVLWKKADDFTEGTDFMAWAFRTAYLQVLNFRRKASRDRLYFSEETIAALSDRLTKHHRDADDRLDALSQCLRRLPEEHRRLVQERYAGHVPVKTIAERAERSANAVSVTLHHIRAALMRCIEMRLKAQA